MRRAYVGLLLLAAASTTAAASERHFTYTYESAVLHPGGREFEPWSTFRLGRDGFYARLDTRLEAELGVSDRLQTSLYLNFSSLNQDTPLGRASSTTLEGLSSEWKLKLSDPVADRAGLALYGELSGGPGEAEVEGKLILDKRVGRWLGALNLTAEHGWEFEQQGGTANESVFEVSAAACYFVRPGLTAGLELRSHTVPPPGDEPTRSALFLGPSVSYSRQGWWIAASALPQLRALAGASSGHRDLVEHEKVELRLIFGLEF
jgi:hypothetical protein